MAYLEQAFKGPDVQTHSDAVDSTAKIHGEAAASLSTKEGNAILTSQASSPDKASDQLPNLSIGGITGSATSSDQQPAPNKPVGKKDSGQKMEIIIETGIAVTLAVIAGSL